MKAQIEILTDNLLAPPSATPQASGSVCLDENQNEEIPIENESITQIDTQEKLVEFNKMLSSADYFQDLVKRLNRGMKATHYKQRMHDTLYTLFAIFCLLSAAGAEKVGLDQKYRGMIRLICYAYLNAW